MRISAWSSDVCSFRSTATPRFLHTDYQGSIVAVTSNTGAALAINAYDEYGIPATSAGGLDQYGRFGYTGQAWLHEIGFYPYKARIYSPTLGTFLHNEPTRQIGSTPRWERVCS